MAETKRVPGQSLAEPRTRRGRSGMDKVAVKTAAEQARFDERQRQQRAKNRNKTALLSESEKQTELKDKARARKVAKFKRTMANLGRKAMVSGPILAPMAVAWTGQAHFAMEKLNWKIEGGLLYAAAYELTTVFCAWMWNEARKDGYGGLEYALAIWAFAIGAAVQQWWHYAGPGMAPTAESVTYSMMTMVGVILWKMYARLLHRRKMVKDGKLPPSRARIGLARWVRYPIRSFSTWSLIILEPDLTSHDAWTRATENGSQVKVERIRQIRKSERTARKELEALQKQIYGSSRRAIDGPRKPERGSERISDGSPADLSGPPADPSGSERISSGPDRPELLGPQTPDPVDFANDFGRTERIPEGEDMGFAPTAAEMQAVAEMTTKNISLSRANICSYMRNPDNKERLGQDGIATNRATLVAAWGKAGN